jgi:hypothetical protein
MMFCCLIESKVKINKKNVWLDGLEDGRIGGTGMGLWIDYFIARCNKHPSKHRNVRVENVT